MGAGGEPVILPVLLALNLASVPAPRDPWFAEDKLRHLVTSFVASTISGGAARAAGVDRTTSIRLAIGAATAAGLAKEIHDAATGSGISGKDLVWNAVGVAGGAALLRETR